MGWGRARIAIALAACVGGCDAFSTSPTDPEPPALGADAGASDGAVIGSDAQPDDGGSEIDGGGGGSDGGACATTTCEPSSKCCGGKKCGEAHLCVSSCLAGGAVCNALGLGSCCIGSYCNRTQCLPCIKSGLAPDFFGATKYASSCCSGKINPSSQKCE